MSYATEVAKVEQGRSALLYVFTAGNETTYYTSYGTVITYESQVYLPRPIRRSGFVYDTKLKSIKMKITAPVMEPFLKSIAAAPYKSCSVQLRRIFLDDPTSQHILFTGDILGVQIRDRVAQATCISEKGVFSKRVPRVFYQAWCNHTLFDSGCGLGEGAWRVDAQISAINNSETESPTFGLYDDGYFTGGVLRFLDDQRLITHHVKADCKVVLLVPFSADLAVGNIVTALPGCSGDPAVCKAKFNNFDDHFVGFPYIPTDNPIVWGFK